MNLTMTRKSPVHFDGTGDILRMPIQFVTVCTKNRRTILANDEAYNALINAWALADLWIVGRHVVMPDHVHLFCAPASFDPPPLGKWIAYWKSMSAKAFPEDIRRPIWQKEYWDTALRSRDSYDEKWEYVVNNPVRAGLVETAEEWPYAGELHELRSH